MECNSSFSQEQLFYPDLYSSYTFAPQPPPNPLYPGLYDHQEFSYPSLSMGTSRPTLTRSIHDQTLALLTKLQNLTNSILKYDRPPAYAPNEGEKKVKSQSSIPPIHIDLADRSFRMFNHETEVHHHHYSHEKGDKGKEESHKNTRLLIGILGTMTTFVMAFFAGKVVAEYEDRQEEFSHFDTLKATWNSNKNCYDDAYQFAIDNMVKQGEDLLQRQRTQKIHKIALMFLGLTSGVLGVVGAVIGSSAMMISALGLGFGVSTISLFKLAYNCFSRREEKMAHALEESLIHLDRIQKPVVYY